jgi:hypothetical protein
MTVGYDAAACPALKKVRHSRLLWNLLVFSLAMVMPHSYCSPNFSLLWRVGVGGE